MVNRLLPFEVESVIPWGSTRTLGRVIPSDVGSDVPWGATVGRVLPALPTAFECQTETQPTYR